MLLEHVGMELDHIARLRSEGDHVDTTSESLEADLRTDNATEFIHHVECVFTAVLIESLETGAATCFEVGDASLDGCFNCRHEVFHEHACAEDGLEAITERGVLEQNLFHNVFLWDRIPVFYCTIKYGRKFSN